MKENVRATQKWIFKNAVANPLLHPGKTSVSSRYLLEIVVLVHVKPIALIVTHKCIWNTQNKNVLSLGVIN